MNGQAALPAPRRCAVYTRKSTTLGLEQDFNSLDAQRESCEAFIKSQAHQGWVRVDTFEDGGFTGASIERPGFRKLMKAVDEGRIDIVVVYKVDRLSRSLFDFVKVMERFSRRNVNDLQVAPSAIALRAAATAKFQATLQGTPATAVTWSVQEAGGGSISSGCWRSCSDARRGVESGSRCANPGRPEPTCCRGYRDGRRNTSGCWLWTPAGNSWETECWRGARPPPAS